jgi:hypothetical protein
MNIMNTKETYNTKRRFYISPNITCIKLDNEISLQLQSDANPEGDPNGWSSNELPNFNNDPFKTNLG